MAPKSRMTIIDFTKCTNLRSFMIRTADNQLFYVDPKFLSIWSVGFREFLENSDENQPQLYNAPVSGNQLLLFLKLIHAQAIFEANSAQEFEEFLSTIDALNAVEGLKEAATFYCIFQSSGVEWAKAFLKSLVTFGGENALNLLEYFNGITPVETFQAAINESMVEWLLNKGSNYISKQILMHIMKNPPKKMLNKTPNEFWERLQKSKFEVAEFVDFDLELRLSEDASVIFSNRSLLANQSSVFASMLGGNFKDGRQQTVHLPDESFELHHDVMFDLLMPTFAGCFWRFRMWSIRHVGQEFRIFGHLCGLQSEQLSNNPIDRNKLAAAKRNLFEVSDKYDILALNTYLVHEIVGSEGQFQFEELIELGDKYANDSILDAGFNKLSGVTAMRLVVEHEAIWKEYNKLTQERLIAALGRLLQTQTDEKIKSFDLTKNFLENRSRNRTGVPKWKSRRY